MPFILSAQAEAKSRNEGTLLKGISLQCLPQAVTTVWRTELGTTLLNGLDSTTDRSAYFRYLCSNQSATKRLQ